VLSTLARRTAQQLQASIDDEWKWNDQRVGSQTVQRRPDGDILLWQRPNKPRGMSGEQYRRYPKSLLMRQVAVDARDKDNRAEQFHVVTTILDAAIDGGQLKVRVKWRRSRAHLDTVTR
jgi:hypothetical protein